MNILVAFFILYFMQTNSGYLEQKVRLFIPFSDENIEKLWKETNVMVRSNAIGIPILAFFQGLLAFVGYWIFGVNNALVWGLLTGFASVIPVVDTMLVWVPVCTVQFFSGDTVNAIILTNLMLNSIIWIYRYYFWPFTHRLCIDFVEYLPH